MDIIMDKSLLFTVHGILLQGIRPITLRFQASRVSAKRGIKRYKEIFSDSIQVKQNN